MSSSKQKYAPAYIVGIGSSEGGLDAVSRILSQLPAEPLSLAIVLAQHLNPEQESNMAELLERTSTWPVEQVNQSTTLEAQKVYLVAPDYDAYLTDHTLVLQPNQTAQPDVSVPSINTLFTSLAQARGENAIGIIVSGTGEDGVEGIKAIYQLGGCVLVQEPDEALQKGMPEAALRSGMVHDRLPANDMVTGIMQYMQGKKRDKFVPVRHSYMQAILQMLVAHSGTDFSTYKPSTISRRIHKRMEALRIHSLEAYHDYLEKNPDELSTLFQTVLIGVTEFFRDPVVFEHLRTYLEKIISRKKKGESIRLWSVGCASGEEPFSIAILLADMLGDAIGTYSIQIFATDIDETAISAGRRGVYRTDQLYMLTPRQLQEYFLPVSNGYELKKSIRQYVLFSRHDITSDPPFVRLDMITCRNLLIYFDNDLQRRVTPVFHYALNPDGYLVLGKSENISQYTDLFHTLDSRKKIFQKKAEGNIHPLKYTHFHIQGARSMPRLLPSPSEMTIEEMAAETLLKQFEYPYMVLDEHMDVAHIKGSMQPYIELSEGSLNSNVLKLLRTELHLELRTLFARVKREQTSGKSDIVRLDVHGNDQFVRLSLKPVLYRKNDKGYFLLIFEKVVPEAKYPFSLKELEKEEYRDAIRILELEQELAATREHLQTFTKELEIANEELQTVNEELQSTNEELKSSNEELETSNEELQSANEELHTANVELALSNDALTEKETELSQTQAELEKSYDRLKLALENLHLMIFYQDKELRYQWVYTTQTTSQTHTWLDKTDYELFGETDEAVLVLKKDVLATGESRQAEVVINGVYYDLVVKPVLENGQIVGLKGLAIDSTDRKTVQHELDSRQGVIHSIIDSSEERIIAVSKDYTVLALNQAQKEEMMRVYHREVQVGDNIMELTRDYPTFRERIIALFEKAFQGERTLTEEYKTMQVNEFGEPRYFTIHALPLRTDAGEIIGAALQSREITRKVRVSQQLQGILQQSANLTGNEFFKDMTDQVSRLFRVRYTYIGLLRDNGKSIETLALRINGRLAQNFTYALQDAPCEQVAIKNEETRYVDHVAQAFPTDTKLQRWEARSYLGIPINSPVSGQVLGILVLISEKPWVDIPGAEHILTVLSLRAGAELERQVYEQKIVERENQLYRITENIPQFIYEYVYTGVTETSYYAFASKAAMEILELSPEEILSNRSAITEVIHPEDMVTLRENWQHTLKKQVVLEWEGRIISRISKKVKWVQVVAKPEQRENGTLVLYGTMTDITQLKQSEIALRVTTEAAEQAARAKEEFLATMSHEIRTPLNAIIGLSGLLLEQETLPEQQTNLQTLKVASDNLVSLINSILDFSKIDAGKVELELLSFGLREILANLYKSHLVHAEERRNSLQLHIADNVPDRIEADPVKIGQVLNNLISNAVKFTENGSVLLQVTLEKMQDAQAWIHFVVQDTGIGISEAQLSKIFDKFTQADSSTVRKYGGTGLGLSISKLLLEMMGSRIFVKSQPGKGTSFSFSLPVTVLAVEATPAPVAPPPLAQPVYTPPGERTIRLLLVEDVELNRMVLVQYLRKKWKMEVDEAPGGAEALELMQNPVYDLILMDIRMPGMDGHETTERIRAQPGDYYQRVPIIALTADQASIDQKSSLFTDVVSKPFNPTELYDKIRRYTSGPVG